MAVKVGINGFGRIGRNVVRAGLHNPNVEFVAVNDITDTKTLAYLLKYDSVLGMLPETVTAEADAIRVGDKRIQVFATKDPAELNWTSVGAQIVVESTAFITAAKAIGLVMPQLKGKLDGYSMRVPTPDVSVVDLVAVTARATTAEEVNAALQAAAEGPMRGILAYTEDPVVSTDMLHNSNSSIVDGGMTKVLDGDLVHVISWYDNEWGYSCRVVDLCEFLAI